jgi:ribosomal protein L12E/L44/L45/RPP1/RPP2
MWNHAVAMWSHAAAMQAMHAGTEDRYKGHRAKREEEGKGKTEERKTGKG